MDSLDRPIPVPRSYYGRTGVSSAIRNDYLYDQRQQHQQQQLRQTGGNLVGGDCSSSDNEDELVRIVDRSGCTRTASRHEEPSASAASRRSRWPTTGRTDHSYGANNGMVPTPHQQSARRVYNYSGAPGGGFDNDGAVRVRPSPQTLPTHHAVPNSIRGGGGVPVEQPRSVTVGTSIPSNNTRHSESCSSLSSVGSGSSSGCEVDGDLGRRRDLVDRLQVASGGDADTLNSSGAGTTAGENVYSRIRDLGFLSTISPPPADTPPAVPQRVAMANASGTQTLGRRPVNRHVMSGHVNHQPIGSAFSGPRDHDGSDSDLPPRFLMHTSSGNVFIPSGNDFNPMSNNAMVPTFPRTVPRTVSLQRTSDRAAAGGPSCDSQNRVSQFVELVLPPPPPINGDMVTRTGNSHDTAAGDERQTMAARFNVVTSTPAAVRPATAAHSELKDYLRFTSTCGADSSYRDKKRSPCERWLTWKCGALSLLSLVAILIAIVAYLLAVRFYNLPWHLESGGPLLTDAYAANGSSLGVPISGSAVSAIIARYQLGHVVQEIIPANDFLRTQFFLLEPEAIKFDVTVPRGSVVGIFGRKNTPPTYTKYDFFHVVDGDKIVLSRQTRSAAGYTRNVGVVDSTFVRPMDVGIWYVFIYNDNDKPLEFTFTASQQDIKASSDCISNCNGHGDCVGSTCHCFPGYSGPACNDSVCPALCSGNGIYHAGTCKCYRGWIGNECHLPAADCVNVDCSQHGACVDGQCVCAAGYSGVNCAEETCSIDCGPQGRCEGQRCLCEPGWTGTTCNQRLCDVRCVRGHCDNGTCVCPPGWNGRHCTLEGCPSSCGRHGNCQLFNTGWACDCEDGWKGTGCEIARETECSSGSDEDRDGLIDCQDPDCCIDTACRDSFHCRIAPDPMDILLRKQPPSPGASFYDRMRFLVEDDSVQSYATLSSFNQTQVSVIRGRVLTPDGSAVVGVRVTVVTQPLYGFTLTREQGWFDMLANGGGSVTLQFQRQPFQTQNVTVIVPWNRIITIDPVTLSLDSDVGQLTGDILCSSLAEHDHVNLKPVVIATWRHSQLGCCDNTPTSIVPEMRVLRERLRISGTNVHLVHDSSDTPGFQSALFIALTLDSVPESLFLIRLRIVVEGVVFEKDFEADLRLQYRYAWDRRNAYNQKVYGVATATVYIGYVYRECRLPFWEVHTVKMAGNDLMSSDIGGWNLDVHHTYSVQDGVVYKGDGSNFYLKMSPRPRRLVTVLGDVSGRRRRVECQGCDGRADGNPVLSPVALASGRDGALYIGDYNYIRRLSPGRDDVASILQLSMPDVQYKYYMVVSPLNGRLYITDQQNLRIIRVKTMGPVRELANNFEVIAGTGHQCVPGSADQCGDGGLAIEARLFYPKGIAINKDGVVYFADGANIRAIDESGIIRTIIGSQGPPQYWVPFPCQQAVNISMVKLRWPTSLGISPLTDELHILDDNVILKVTRYHKVIMVAGRPSHCSLSNTSSLPSSGDPLTAVDGRLEHAQNFAFSPDGELFLVESNADDVNRVRVVDTSGRIQHYVGSQCECQGRPNCRCNISSLSTPSAVAVTPDGIVHIADTGIACVHSAVTAEPVPDRSGQFEVVSGPLNEVYVFNRYGQHLSTRDLGTGLLMYNFTYNGYSHYGRLLKVTDAGGQTLVIRRDYKLVARDISAANGERSRITTDTMGQLQAFTTADNVTIRFTYSGNTGLIESREDMTSSQQYEYNEVGHLSAVVLTDGRRITVKDGDTGFSGKQVIVAAENSLTKFAITDASIDVSQDNLKRTARYIKNGVMSVELSADTNVVHEFNDKLATNEYQLSQRRLIHLPNNMTHTTEWWYQLRQDGTHAGASGKANSASGEKLVRRLKVNGETLLSIDLDRVENIETVYSRGHDRLLTVRYDRSGRPIQATPSGPLEPLNVTYGTHGHVTSWTRGDLGVVNVYDEKTGNLVERKLANRVAYRYIYKTGSKPTDVLLPSGRQYQLHYSVDDGGLVALTTPSLAHHQFQRVESLGIDRIIYQPPDANPLRPSYIRDYDSLGRTSQVLYPSGHRRITYNYRASRTFIFYDWTDVTLDHDAPSGQLIEARLTDRLASNFSVSTRYISSGPLVSSQIVSFGVESSPAATVTSSAGASDGGLSGATFQYSYDPVSLNVIGVEATFGDQSLGTSQFNYSSDTGRLTRTQSFIFEYPQAHREVVRDSNIEITRDFDSRGRFTDVWFRFNNYLVCSLEVKHDALGRIHQWRRKVGSSDLRAYERVYNVDGDVTEVHVSGQPTWRYEYDTDGNIIKANHHGNVRTFSIDAPLGGRLDSASEQSYVHDADGRVVQRDRETFEYDAFGGLTRAFEPGRYDVTFHYDAFHRLVVKRDVIAGDVVQYFYADVSRKDRITHIVETSGQSVVVVGGTGGIGGSRGGSGVNVGGGNRRRMTELFYDSRGKLFAMRRDNNIHYVALDPTDSPVVVLNSVGSVVKQIEYDPLGATLTDSAPDHLFPLGFRCGVVDLATRLVLFVDGRAYDPSIGRWMVPDYDRLVTGIDRLVATPELSNLYSATSFLWKNGETDGGFTTDLSDWLNQLGYDYTRIVPSVDFTSETIRQSLKSTDTSTIDTSMMLTTRVSMTSLIECAFRRSSFDVSRLSAVKRSKIVNPDNLAFQTVASSSTFSDSTRRRSRRVVSSLAGLFGRGVLISELGGGDSSDGVAGGPVIVGVLESAAESGLALVATTLLNTSRVVPFVYTVGGRDVHHFVHARNDRSADDLRELGGLKPDIGATVAGVNITVHRHRKPSASGTETVEESIEVRLHGERTLISVRYGTTVSAETERVLRKAGQRAADMAWKIERERAQSGKRSVSTWTKRQVDELLSRGLVSGVHPVYTRGIAEFPKLADDPNNVRFVPSTA